MAYRRNGSGRVPHPLPPPPTPSPHRSRDGYPGPACRIGVARPAAAVASRRSSQPPHTASRRTRPAAAVAATTAAEHSLASTHPAPPPCCDCSAPFRLRLPPFLSRNWCPQPARMSKARAVRVQGGVGSGREGGLRRELGEALGEVVVQHRRREARRQPVCLAQSRHLTHTRRPGPRPAAVRRCRGAALSGAVSQRR